MQSYGLIRVTVATPSRRVDMALPEHAAVAEILPGLLAHTGEPGAADGGWLLRRADGTAFDPERTLGGYRVRDGEILHLTPRRTDWPEVEYDDLADAVATGATGRGWGPRHTRAAGLTCGAGAVLLGLLAVLRAGPPWTAPALWALGVAGAALVAGVVASRAFGDAGTGAVLAGVALPLAFAGGGLLLAGDESRFGAGHLLLAGAALLLAGVIGYVGVAAAPALFCGAATVGVLTVLGGWLAGTDTVAGHRAAAVVGAVALVVSSGFAPLALRLGRVPMPVLPRSAADLVRDEPQPPLAVVHAAVARADALLTGMLCGVALVAACCAALLVRSRGTAELVLVGVLAAGFGLRARLYPVVRQRVPVLAAGLVGAGSLVLVGAPLIAGTVAVAGAALAVGAGLVRSVRAAGPYAGRIAEYLEMLIMVAVVPVACWVLGLYDHMRGLGG